MARSYGAPTQAGSTLVSPGPLASPQDDVHARVVRAVKRFGGVTQADLAAATGLPVTTVSAVVSDLSAAGVLETEARSWFSRRALRVRMSRRAGIVAGVHVAPRGLSVVLGDPSGSVIAEQHLPLPPEHRPDTTLDRGTLLVVDLMEGLGADISELLSVGVGVAAQVDRATGRIGPLGRLPGWADVNVAENMGRRLEHPVHVDEDVNLAALAERQSGAAQGAQDFVFVQLSHGASAAIVVGDRVHRGAVASAGQIGHVQVSADGPSCLCGNRGCLDAAIGETAVLGRLGAHGGILTLRDVIRLAADGEPRCLDVLCDVAAQVGEVIAGVVRTFDPERVVVGGELAQAGGDLVARLAASAQGSATWAGLAPVAVVPGRLGTRAQVLGALDLARRAALSPAGVPA